jgi:hypothetical protein
MSETDDLRKMVREVLREVLPPDAVGSAPTTPTSGAAAPSPDVRRVRVRDDRDLADVVTQVLNLAAEPAGAADLRAGRIRFALAGDETAAATAVAAPIDVDRGAVTERLIWRAAREQRPLRLGPRAVVTPLARDRARALGVSLDRTSSDPSSTQKGETR